MARLIAPSILSLSLLILASLPLIAGDAERSFEKERADTADRADTLIASHRETLSPAEKLTEATYVMMEELIEISKELRSVKDVRKARPRIAEAMKKIVLITEEMIADAVSLTSEDQTGLQNMQSDMQKDPRFEELSDRANKAQSTLTKRSPEAAAEFQKITQEEGMKMAQAMMTAMQKMMGQAMRDAGVDPNAPDPEQQEKLLEDVPSPAMRLTEAIYTMMEDLIEISESIASIEDADDARPRIVTAMWKVVALTEEMMAEAASFTHEELADLRSSQDDMQEDPRYLELSERATEAQEKMAGISPEGAERFQEITQEEGLKMVEAIQKVMAQILDETDEEYEE